MSKGQRPQGMKSHDPIVNRWRETWRRKAAAPAILNPDAGVARTFDDIQAEAEQWEAKLNELPSGSVLALQIGNHPAWPALFLAGLRLQVCILPLENTITLSERSAALEICKAGYLVTSDASGTLVFTTIDRSRSLRGAIHNAGEFPSLLKLTSGTTAAPRAIRFRSPQLLADCDQICETMGISEDDLNFGVIPVSHSYGFSNLITPLIARGVATVLSRDRLPRAVLNALATTRATVFPGMPVFYQAFCGMSEYPDLDHLRLCISAGAPLSAALAGQHRVKLGKAIHSFYGSSECGGICYDRTGEDADGFVGAPMSGVTLDVDKGVEASRIRVRSAAVADGYFPEADAVRLGNGVFLPDDLLRPHGSGFKIVGRLSDLINVAGKKVNPAEVEAHLLGISGVREAIVFGCQSDLRNEEVAACVVAAENVDEAQLILSCRRHLSGWQVPKRIFVVPEIPVNERGKTSRRDLGLKFARSQMIDRA